MLTQLCWAFGSNLSHRQMARRCPAARPVAPLTLPDAVLRFRGVADVAYLKGAACPGGLWELTPADELALDEYEGVATGLYEKRYLRLVVDGVPRCALYYLMTTTGIYPPTQAYLDGIVEGYRDFGLDLERLRRAVEHSFARLRKTPVLRRRLRRKGLTPADLAAPLPR